MPTRNARTLASVIKRINWLKRGLAAEIVQQEEVSEEFPVCCNSGHCNGYIDGAVQKQIYQQRIAFPDFHRRDLSKKRLEKTYSSSPHYNSRAMAGEALGYSTWKIWADELRRRGII